MKMPEVPCIDDMQWLPFAGRPIQPFALKLETEHLSLRASGWRTTTGFLLRQPASATVTFTPALAKYVTNAALLVKLYTALASTIQSPGCWWSVFTQSMMYNIMDSPCHAADWIQMSVDVSGKLTLIEIMAYLHDGSCFSLCQVKHGLRAVMWRSLQVWFGPAAPAAGACDVSQGGQQRDGSRDPSGDAHPL